MVKALADSCYLHIQLTEQCVLPIGVVFFSPKQLLALKLLNAPLCSPASIYPLTVARQLVDESRI